MFPSGLLEEKKMVRFQFLFIVSERSVFGKSSTYIYRLLVVKRWNSKKKTIEKILQFAISTWTLHANGQNNDRSRLQSSDARIIVVTDPRTRCLAHSVHRRPGRASFENIYTLHDEHAVFGSQLSRNAFLWLPKPWWYEHSHTLTRRLIKMLMICYRSWIKKIKPKKV